MKRVVCLYNGYIKGSGSLLKKYQSQRLTVGKIYDVISYHCSDIEFGSFIFITDNVGDEVSYYLESFVDNELIVWFRDSTYIERDNKLKKIGI